MGFKVTLNQKPHRCGFSKNQKRFSTQLRKNAPKNPEYASTDIASPSQIWTSAANIDERKF